MLQVTCVKYGYDAVLKLSVRWEWKIQYMCICNTRGWKDKKNPFLRIITVQESVYFITKNWEVRLLLLDTRCVQEIAWVADANGEGVRNRKTREGRKRNACLTFLLTYPNTLQSRKSAASKSSPSLVPPKTLCYHRQNFLDQIQRQLISLCRSAHQHSLYLYWPLLYCLTRFRYVR